MPFRRLLSGAVESENVGHSQRCHVASQINMTRPNGQPCIVLRCNSMANKRDVHFTTWIHRQDSCRHGDVVDHWNCNDFTCHLQQSRGKWTRFSGQWAKKKSGNRPVVICYFFLKKQNKKNKNGGRLLFEPRSSAGRVFASSVNFYFVFFSAPTFRKLADYWLRQLWSVAETKSFLLQYITADWSSSRGKKASFMPAHYFMNFKDFVSSSVRNGTGQLFFIQFVVLGQQIGKQLWKRRIPRFSLEWLCATYGV